MDEIRFDKKWNAGYQDLPAGAIRTVLSITQAAGLVRLTRHGFSVTEVGRDVQRRIEPETPTQLPQIRAVHFIPGNRCRTDATLSSLHQPVLRDVREKVLTPAHQ